MGKFIKDPKGYALALTLGLMALVTGLGVGALNYSGMQGQFWGNQKVSTQAFWLAEAGLNAAAYQLSYVTSNNLTVPNTLTPVSSNLNLGQGTFQYTWTALPGSTSTITNGIRTYIDYWQINSTGKVNDVSVNLIENVQRQETPVFQFGIFYKDNLEILPGAPMTITGLIHTNSNLYIGANGTSLTIGINSSNNNSTVTAAGSIYNDRLDGGTLNSPDTVSIMDQSTGQYQQILEAGDTAPLDSNNPDWGTESLERWDGSVLSGATGAIPIQIPTIQSTQPGGYYDTNSGLKIVNTTAYFNGTQVTLPSNTIYESSFTDVREGATVTVTNIDIGKLNSSGYFPTNGLIYATRNDATSSQPNGIKLTDGSTINNAANGLTVVSNDPIYIQGDYNTVNEVPSAVIADAVNILSTNWNDANPVSNRIATATTINTAFVSGIDPTVGSQYSGGFENYIRFLENWSGVNINVMGSFVEEGDSQIAIAPWSISPSVYTPPDRHWSFDTLFYTKSPPFTPLGVGVVPTSWQREPNS